MGPDLSIIIVSFNCRDALGRCLDSLHTGAGRLTTETIVIDNASSDATPVMVSERFPGVRLIVNPTNRGFAAANNQGIALATGRHIILLNPDTVVHPGALEKMVGVLDGDATIGVCGPQLLNTDGSVQPSVRSFPTTAALLHQYTPLRAVRLLKGAYRRYKMADFDFHRPADVDVVMGAAFCIPRRVLAEVGVLDERFFVYCEELDFCLRVRQAGYRVRFEPAAKVTHEGGVSAASAASNLFFCRSLLRYLRKHRPGLGGRALAAGLLAGMFVQETLMLVGNVVAAAALAVVGRFDRARRRAHRARSALRFVACDAWRVLLRP